MRSLRTQIRILLITAIALPIASVTLRFVAGLLAAMEDAGGAAVVRDVATVCASMWPVVLVGLLLASACETLHRE